MEEPLLKKIADWADRKQVLMPGTAVVAGISGGADSVCLLHILLSLARLRSFSIFAVHINHMLRGSESDGDESFVRGLCAKWQVPLQAYREDVGSFAAENGRSVEEAGRMVRYERFRKVMKETGAQYVAVAHHKDDQAETVFFHLLRGSGLEGLCGMEDVSQWLLRPLLETGRDEIQAYMNRNGLACRTDSSNQDNAYTRNVIRNELFPLIQQKTGFPVATSLLRTARLLRSDRDFLQQMAAAQYERLLLPKENNAVALRREALCGLHPAMAGRCIRMAWKEVTGSVAGLEEKHIAAVLELSGRKASGQSLQLPKGVFATIEYERLLLAENGRETEGSPFQVPLNVPGMTELPERGLLLYAALHDREEYEKAFNGFQKPKETSLCQIFDYGKINKGINIRNRRNGDIFFPYRSPGSKKLKEYLIDEKIPRAKRENIPLLAVDNNIIWVMGFRTSEKYKVDEASKVILSVRAEKGL
jgi:tRNA(Ile)-lysidine synthase